MSFSYYVDPASPQERDYVRFRIQDTVENSGPLPGDRNFSDHELDMIITEEGSWQKAITACYEALAAAWMVNPSWSDDGMSISQSHIGKNFSDLAAAWRNKYGGSPGSSAFSRSMIRVDGYSDDIASDEVS